MWNPWRGCHKYSEGCRFCYIHKGDKRKGLCTNEIVKTAVEFRQLGTHFVKDGRMYTLNTRDLCSQAKKAGINYYPPKE